jgi:hypothetical protein
VRRARRKPAEIARKRLDLHKRAYHLARARRPHDFPSGRQGCRELSGVEDESRLGVGDAGPVLRRYVEYSGVGDTQVRVGWE